MGWSLLNWKTLIKLSTYDMSCHSNHQHIQYNHLPGTSQYSCHICLPGNGQRSDIWRMSRFVHRWHHSDKIRVVQCICCNLVNEKRQTLKTKQTRMHSSRMRAVRSSSHAYTSKHLHWTLCILACTEADIPPENRMTDRQV